MIFGSQLQKGKAMSMRYNIGLKPGHTRLSHCCECEFHKILIVKKINKPGGLCKRYPMVLWGIALNVNQ